VLVVETRRFFGWRRRRITSRVVVLRTDLACGVSTHEDPRLAPQLTLSISSEVKGVYEVMRKWHRGVGIRLAMIPTRSLFI
jgi:hypothetical protein